MDSASSFSHIGAETSPTISGTYFKAGVTFFHCSELAARDRLSRPRGRRMPYVLRVCSLSIFMRLWSAWDFLFEPLSAAVQARRSVSTVRPAMVHLFFVAYAGTFSAHVYEFDATLQYTPGPTAAAAIAIWLQSPAMPWRAVSGWARCSRWAMELEEGAGLLGILPCNRYNGDVNPAAA